MPRAKTARKPTPAVAPVVQETLEQKAARLRLLQRKLERTKPIYKQVDPLEWEIAQAMTGEAVPVVVFEQQGKKFRVKVKDQFAEKNTAYKPAAVKRFIVEFEEVE
jgi:hypothetical protein